MPMDRETISQRMRTTVPRCIASFIATPADRPEPWVGDDIAVWRNEHGPEVGLLRAGFEGELGRVAFLRRKQLEGLPADELFVR